MSRSRAEQTEAALLAIIARRGEFHYIESLTRETGLSVTTVGKYVHILEAKGLVKTKKLATVRQIWAVPE